MAKALAGAAMIGAVVGFVAFAALTGGIGVAAVFAGMPWLAAVLAGGVAMEAGAIAGALTSNRGMNITTRSPASFRQIVYGSQRVGGVIIYRSTTGGHHDQYNYVIVLATHVIDAIENLYLDGRRVFWNGSNTGGNGTRNGCNFGGPASGGAFTGPDGAHYNFDTLVYCEARFGDQADGDSITGLTANDPHWAPAGGKTPWVGGCAYVYLKVEYDEAMFSGEPEIRFTLRGKNDILDPRTGLTGYTCNWALVTADVLADPVWGLGDGAAINTAQLIAAANVCDEQVACLAGLEARYSCHWHYDTSTAPGDVLNQMLAAAAGRLSRIGGQWFLWPAYWQGPSFTFDANALAGAVEWHPNRGLAELFNRVTGTYVAPNYPYNVAGNLYDANGWYYGAIANQFPYGFQPTNYPQYAADPLHGYADDQYLLEDGGIVLPREIGQPCVLSIAQAQRVAKLYLLRNRQQGTGTFLMSLAAWGLQPCDVMLFNFAAAGWESKQLEVTGFRFKIDDQGGGEGEQAAPRIWLEFDVAETDASVYEWSAAEELGPYDVPSTLTGIEYTPAPPTDMTLASLGQAIVGADGIAIPRVRIGWLAPQDGLVTQIAIQYQAAGAASWTDDGAVGVASIQAFVSGVVAGGIYNFRIASLRANGAMSPWVEVDNYTVATTLSAIPAAVIASGTLAPARLPAATATTPGAIVPDGRTLTVSNGVLSATGTPAAPAAPIVTPPSATPVFDGASGGTLFLLTLNQDVTGSTAQNLTPGQQYYFLIQQPPAAVFAFQWPANLANAQPVALTPGARSLQPALAVSSTSLLASGVIQYFTS